MKNFNRGGGNFGRRDSNRGSGNFGRPEMHSAICAECGVSCEVPFKPTGDKPVYCSNCFSGKDESRQKTSSRRDFGRNDSRGRDRGERKMFKTICTECGVSCEVPFNPSSDKPVLCSACFENSRNRDRKGGGNNQFENQFKIINDKLDAILKNFSSDKSKISNVKAKPIVKVEVKKKIIKAKKVVKKVAKKAKK